MQELAAVLKVMMILRRLDAGDDHEPHRTDIMRCAAILGVVRSEDAELVDVFDDVVRAAEKQVDDELRG